LADSCEGARTPDLTALVMVVPLSARERDIATLAAPGESSKAIAEGMADRIAAVGGRLDVESRPGDGTRVSGSAPRDSGASTTPVA
jgi:hypothetical protein